jgi:hypothetical protein
MVVRDVSGGAIPAVALAELLLKATGVSPPGVDDAKVGKLESDDGISEGRAVDTDLRRVPLVDDRGCKTLWATVLRRGKSGGGPIVATVGVRIPNDGCGFNLQGQTGRTASMN